MGVLQLESADGKLRVVLPGGGRGALTTPGRGGRRNKGGIIKTPFGKWREKSQGFCEASRTFERGETKGLYKSLSSLKKDRGTG